MAYTNAEIFYFFKAGYNWTCESNGLYHSEYTLFSLHVASRKIPIAFIAIDETRVVLDLRKRVNGAVTKQINALIDTLVKYDTKYVLVEPIDNRFPSHVLEAGRKRYR